MVKIIIDLLDFIRASAPLLTSVAVWALIFVLLAKPIKKRPGLFYTLFAIPFILVAIPSICGWFGIKVMSFSRIPVFGEVIRDYIHMGTFGHPLLIIIMYIGALNIRQPGVKKLMSIRKEMSIISGFAVFAHSLIRVVHNFPNALKYFTDHEEYLENTRVVSDFGAGFSSFSYVLGIFMLILFIPLWVTSFDKIHKRMGQAKWKKLQKWSYVLYATLFIHAMGIQIGGMLNPRGGRTAPVKSDVTAVVTPKEKQGEQSETARLSTSQSEGRPNNQGRERNQQVNGEQRNKGQQGTQQQATSGRTPTKTLADFKPGTKTRQYIHLFSLLLIYGSYLFLRLRKAKKI